jgi:hypothetical protein
MSSLPHHARAHHHSSSESDSQTRHLATCRVERKYFNPPGPQIYRTVSPHKAQRHIFPPRDTLTSESGPVSPTRMLGHKMISAGAFHGLACKHKSELLTPRPAQKLIRRRLELEVRVLHPNSINSTDRRSEPRSMQTGATVAMGSGSAARRPNECRERRRVPGPGRRGRTPRGPGRPSGPAPSPPPYALRRRRRRPVAGMIPTARD